MDRFDRTQCACAHDMSNRLTIVPVIRLEPQSEPEGYRLHALQKTKNKKSNPLGESGDLVTGIDGGFSGGHGSRENKTRFAGADRLCLEGRSQFLLRKDSIHVSLTHNMLIYMRKH